MWRRAGAAVELAPGLWTAVIVQRTRRAGGMKAPSPLVAAVAEPRGLGYVGGMSGARHGRGGVAARWRALAAVLSLYGLVLQAFLAGLNPVPVAAGAGLICQAHRTTEAGEPAPAGHGAYAHACCTLACPAPLAPPASAAAAAWPPRAAIVLSWRVEGSSPARPSPERPASARGPPVA